MLGRSGLHNQLTVELSLLTVSGEAHMVRLFAVSMRMRVCRVVRVRIESTADQNVAPARTSIAVNISFISVVLTGLLTMFQLWDHVSSAITTVF